MKNTNKNLKSKIKVVNHLFPGGNITKYLGINTVSKYLKKQKTDKDLNRLFPTNWYNSTKFGTYQILLSIIFASLAGINRIKRIANFTQDPLIKVNLGLKDALELHSIYKQRSTSETWIEQVKSQLLAGKTLTDDFWANDIFWQLNCYSYNISVSMRVNHKKFRKQEHKTFRDWFILVPAKLASSGHKIQLKIYENYYCKSNWIEFDEFLNTV